MEQKFKKVVDCLLKFGEETLKNSNDTLVKDTINYPISFVLCCLADKNVDAGIAWSIHSYIKEYSFDEMLKFDVKKWEKILLKTGYNRPYKLAEEYCNAINTIKVKYKGNVEKLWTESSSYAEIISKFLEFNGIGIKIATMATNLLKRYFGIEKNCHDEHFMDISPDTHVRNIFKKLGFIDENISDNSDKENKRIIYAARALNPNAPYALDYPCYIIGKTFCHKRGQKRCTECPIREYCQSM